MSQDMTDYLAANPKMVGVLFTALMLANAGMGSAAASAGSIIPGP